MATERIAKARERSRRDLGNVRYIKDQGGRTIAMEEDIRKRRGLYFASLFNESRSERSGEVKMGRNKAVGPDQIPIEAWRCLGDGSRRIDDDVSHRIRIGWVKWRAALGVLCDKRVPIKLKGKFYRVAIRSAMLYGSEGWSIIKAQANKVEEAELRMLRWTCGKTMLDMILNGVFKAKLEVDSIIYKMREGRLRWFGHVKRRPQVAPIRRVEDPVVNDLRRRGRPKLRWEDRLKQDMKELLLFEDITSNRNAWRDRIRISG
ncbi:hypothetical protein Tco_1538317 [Tanacetum coccineum]